MPEHALYYPGWNISDPVFMVEALLYWDHIACMVPFPDFRELPWHKDEDMKKALAEAHEYLIYNWGGLGDVCSQSALRGIKANKMYTNSG